MSIHLFEHNQKAYEAVTEMLEKDGMAAVIHPTGTGKSMIAFKLVEEHPLNHFLWLFPKRIHISDAGRESEYEISEHSVSCLTVA